MHSAIRSMAPLSLLGTVVRDKMMKTVTVQVISPPSVIVTPCFLKTCAVQKIMLLFAVVACSSSIRPMRAVLICMLMHTLVGLSSLPALTRVPPGASQRRAPAVQANAGAC